jgi:hypothetical protein
VLISYQFHDLLGYTWIMASRHLPGRINILAEEQAGEATALWALQQYDAALQTLQRLEGMLPQHKASA